mmetsp:Transcript_19304/g.28755  ORF Transcript_19304/g.28755 Transcript_19304/m.28755 type:complete len:82 (-) Transcript_19304:240-485(-)
MILCSGLKIVAPFVVVYDCDVAGLEIMSEIKKQLIPFDRICILEQLDVRILILHPARASIPRAVPSNRIPRVITTNEQLLD